MQLALCYILGRYYLHFNILNYCCYLHKARNTDTHTPRCSKKVTLPYWLPLEKVYILLGVCLEVNGCLIQLQ